MLSWSPSLARESALCRACRVVIARLGGPRVVGRRVPPAPPTPESPVTLAVTWPAVLGLGSPATLQLL